MTNKSAVHCSFYDHLVCDEAGRPVSFTEISLALRLSGIINFLIFGRDLTPTPPSSVPAHTHMLATRNSNSPVRSTAKLGCLGTVIIQVIYARYLHRRRLRSIEQRYCMTRTGF